MGTKITNRPLLYLLILLFVGNPVSGETTSYTSSYVSQINVPPGNFDIADISLSKNSLIEASIFIFIPIHPWNKLPFIELVLAALENQIYPKYRIHIKFATERYLDDENICSQSILEQNKKSIQKIITWADYFSGQYKKIDVKVDTLRVTIKLAHKCSEQIFEHQKQYWSHGHDKFVSKLKQEALSEAKSLWADIFLVMDADVILYNSHAIAYFTKLIINNRLDLISPMLDSVNQFSNFWTKIDSNGDFEYNDEYENYITRRVVGYFEVPLVHSSIFFNLNSIKVDRCLTFLPDESTVPKYTTNRSYDDMINLAKFSKACDIKMYIDNTNTWGILPPLFEDIILFESSNLEDQLNDLKVHLVYSATSDIIDIETYMSGIFKNSYAFIDQKTEVAKNFTRKISEQNVFVINLAKRRLRREKIKVIDKILNIPIKFSNKSIDGNEEGMSMFRNYNITLDPEYRDPRMNRSMTWGEVGCFLSHYNIWLEIIENNYTSTIIFEDDFKLVTDFLHRWNYIFENEIIHYLGNVDLIYLGRKNLTPDKKERHASEHLVYPNYSYWMVGYLLTNKGAKKLIDARPLECLVPLDELVPFMYGANNLQNSNSKCFKHLKNRLKGLNFVALSVKPDLVEPQIYSGDIDYISDTEFSKQIFQ